MKKLSIIYLISCFLFFSTWVSNIKSQYIPSKIVPEKIEAKNNSKIINLNLQFNEEQIILNKAYLSSGTASKRSFTLDGNWYNLQLFNSDEARIYEQSFRDPRILFFDNFEPSTGKLSGGFVYKKNASITLKIPFFENAVKLQLVSPEKQIAWESTTSNLLRDTLPLAKTAQWETETLIYNGPPENTIDLVFLGDGYTINDTTRFVEDVLKMTEFLFFEVIPYNEYYSYFNVHVIKVISEESGADHPEAYPAVYKNTALGCTYDYFNIPRLIGCNWDTVYAITEASLPYYDKICVLVNDPKYGGSGGDISISYNGTYGKWVFNHEFGHSFGYLLDEYLYSNSNGEVFGCNCDTDETSISWLSWIEIGSPGVGTFQGCSYINYFRPTFNECTMNALRDQFCVVCAEQLTKSINTRVFSFDSYFPPYNPTVESGDSLLFYITPLNPVSHKLKTHWYVNMNPQEGSACDSFVFYPPEAGTYDIMAAIFDSTYLVLNDPDYSMVDAQEWQVQVTPKTNINEITNLNTLSSFILETNYPNPFNSSTKIDYYLPINSQIVIDVYDLSGRFIKKLTDNYQTKGHYSISWNGTKENGSQAASGVYFYKMKSPSGFVATKKMILIK